MLKQSAQGGLNASVSMTIINDAQSGWAMEIKGATKEYLKTFKIYCNSRHTRKARRSKPPDSSTLASAGFQATA